MASSRLGLDFSVATLLTLGNLVCGFFAVFATAGGGGFGVGPGEACQWILLAMAFDGLDGLVARRLGIETRFGRFLDNLADMVSFGVAPGLLVAKAFDLPPAVAVPAAVFYVVGASLRLARFASEPPEQLGPKSFSGLPTPAAALVVTGMVMAEAQGFLPWILCFVLGGMMLSRVACPHPAALGRWSVAAAAALVLVYAVKDLTHAVLAAAAAYLVWAFGFMLRQR